MGGNEVRFPIAQSLSGGTQRLSLLGIARPGQKRGGATRALAHVGNQHFGCLSQVIHERPSSISPRTTKAAAAAPAQAARSEEHTSELKPLMPSSYAVFCLKKKTRTKKTRT